MFSEADILLDKSNQLSDQKESSFAYHFFTDLGRTPQNEQWCGKVSCYMIIHLRLASPIPPSPPPPPPPPPPCSILLFLPLSFSFLELLSLFMVFSVQILPLFPRHTGTLSSSQWPHSTALDHSPQEQKSPMPHLYCRLKLSRRASRSASASPTAAAAAGCFAADALADKDWPVPGRPVKNGKTSQRTLFYHCQPFSHTLTTSSSRLILMPQALQPYTK